MQLTDRTTALVGPDGVRVYKGICIQRDMRKLLALAFLALALMGGVAVLTTFDSRPVFATCEIGGC